MRIFYDRNSLLHKINLALQKTFRNDLFLCLHMTLNLLLYVLKNKEGIFIDFLLFCSDYFDELIVLMLVSPRWIIFVTGSWPVYFC